MIDHAWWCKAKIAGIESFGMVLCGVDNDETLVEFVEPPSSAVVGERVLIGTENESTEPWRPNRIKKKKAWKKLSQEFKLINGKAMFEDEPMEPISGGHCHTSTKMSGVIR
eukprot:g4381.t1